MRDAVSGSIVLRAGELMKGVIIMCKSENRKVLAEHDSLGPEAMAQSDVDRSAEGDANGDGRGRLRAAQPTHESRFRGEASFLPLDMETISTSKHQHLRLHVDDHGTNAGTHLRSLPFSVPCRRHGHPHLRLSSFFHC